MQESVVVLKNMLIVSFFKLTQTNKTQQTKNQAIKFDYLLLTCSLCVKLDYSPVLGSFEALRVESNTTDWLLLGSLLKL